MPMPRANLLNASPEVPGTNTTKAAKLAELPVGMKRAVVLRSFTAQLDISQGANLDELRFGNPHTRVISAHRMDHKGKGLIVCQNVIVLSDERFNQLSKSTEQDGIQMRAPLVREFIPGQDDHLIVSMEPIAVDSFGVPVNPQPSAIQESSAKLGSGEKK